MLDLFALTVVLDATVPLAGFKTDSVVLPPVVRFVNTVLFASLVPLIGRVTLTNAVPLMGRVAFAVLLAGRGGAANRGSCFSVSRSTNGYTCARKLVSISDVRRFGRCSEFATEKQQQTPQHVPS